MSERKTKLQRCKYCEQGIRLVGGEHWLVKSIFPARITTYKCKAVVAQPKAEVQS